MCSSKCICPSGGSESMHQRSQTSKTHAFSYRWMGRRGGAPSVRNCKASVDLGLPPQRVVTHALRFSSIERHWYAKQHRECADSAREALALLRKEGAGAAAKAERALEKLSKPLLRLRQACCHPQLGSFGIQKRRGAGGGLPARARTVASEPWPPSLLRPR